MSLASEQSSQLATSVFLDNRSSHSVLTQAILELRQCKALYSGDVDDAAAAVVYSIVKNLGITSCQIWLYTDDCSQFRPIAQYGVLAAAPPNLAINVADYPDYFDSLTQRDRLIINTGSSIARLPRGNSPQRESDHDLSAIFPPYLAEQKYPITALAEIPIYHQGQLAGVLCCAQRQSPRVWQGAEQSFMVTAACLIALAISHSRQHQQTQSLNQQKRQLTLAIIERQQAEQAWQESQRFIQGILDASTNILYVNDFSTGVNYYVNGYMKDILGYAPSEVQQLGAQFLEKLAHHDDITAIHQARQKLAQSSCGDIIETEYRLRHKHGSWHWMLCRETIFQWNQDGTPLQLLGTATDITVHKKNTEALRQQNQELTALAMVDALTQIANRRALDEFLRQAWAALNHTPLTLILCDIDYFKRYNDTYGHPKGDECLRLVAQALKTAVKRQPDFVARYGGEEFAIVLPNTSLAGARHVAQNIQTTVRDLKIEHGPSDAGDYLTVSMGIATVSSTAYGSPQALIAAADRGLYQAKADGRARFSVGHPDLPDLMNVSDRIDPQVK
ncbi:MAG: diguanylate cyclase [Cyanobacteria bacterium P01_B01_bin.77]